MVEAENGGLMTLPPFPLFLLSHPPGPPENRATEGISQLFSEKRADQLSRRKERRLGRHGAFTANIH